MKILLLPIFFVLKNRKGLFMQICAIKNDTYQRYTNISFGNGINDIEILKSTLDKTALEIIENGTRKSLLDTGIELIKGITNRTLELIKEINSDNPNHEITTISKEIESYGIDLHKRVSTAFENDDEGFYNMSMELKQKIECPQI